MSPVRRTPGTSRGSGPLRWFEDGTLHVGVGIEDTFVPQSRPGERALDEYALTEHYERWHADLGLAAEVGAELVRWGVPWYRVEPEPGRFDWDWLDRVLDRFAELGLRPVVDLLHYGTPLWLEGEFAHPDYPARVADYSVAVAERFGDRATDYTPVNEPMIHALFCGEYAYWPPYLAGHDGLVTLCAQLTRGFQRAQAGIAEVLPDATFVHVDAGMRYDGDPEHAATIRRLRESVWLVEDLATGRVDARHPLVGFLTEHGLSDDDLAEFRERAVRPDVVGVNYYPRHSTEILRAGESHVGGFADPRPTRDDGTAGLVELLRQAAARYGAPVALTETCVTGTVAERVAWMDASFAAVADLRAEGLDVVAYTWWPLFDMYEWTWRTSDGPRADHLLTMGLYALEERADGLARVPTPLVGRFLHHARRARRAAHRDVGAAPAEGQA
jgi:beta-glucosidase/6-phospho-beta-glucosidase/beta-galactosidase